MGVTVKVKIGNVEVELSLEEASELHAVLGRICGKSEPVIVAPVAVPYYVHYEYAPWYRQVWCSSSGNITLSATGTISCTAAQSV